MPPSSAASRNAGGKSGRAPHAGAARSPAARGPSDLRTTAPRRPQARPSLSRAASGALTTAAAVPGCTRRRRAGRTARRASARASRASRRRSPHAPRADAGRARAARSGPPSRRGSAVPPGVVRRRTIGSSGCARSSSPRLVCSTTVTSPGGSVPNTGSRRSRVSSSRPSTAPTSSPSRSSWRATKWLDELSTQAHIARPSFATGAGAPALRRSAGTSGGSASRSSAA